MIMTGKETMVTRYNVYLPSIIESNRTIATAGERRFFENKFWKLAVLLGYDWNNSILIQTGFSVLNRVCKTNADIINFLDTNNIQYNRVPSNTGYCLYLKISKQRSNLHKIDELYLKFYKEQLSKAATLGLWYEENYLVNKEMITIADWATGNKRIQKL